MPEYRFDGSQLRAVREDRRLNEGQLAARINRSQPLIALWELGYRIPPIAKVVEIAAVLDVDVKDFFVVADEVAS